MINILNFIHFKKFWISFLIILSFIFLSLFSVFLLIINHKVYLGMDTQFHFRRVMELSTSLINNNILPNFSFNYFHGSSVLTLYPYLNLIPAVILSFIINSKINLVYSIIIYNFLMIFIVSFYSCKNYTKSYTTSYVFSIVYGMSNIFFFYNVIFSDFGIVSSYIVMPLIIFGFLKILQEKNGWIELSLGMTILFYSHILNLVIISVFLLILLFININRINIYIMFNLIKSVLLFVITTSIVWLPFLHLYFTNLGNINMPINITLNNVDIKQFLSGLYGSKNDQTIGFFPFIALFISPIFYKVFTHYVKQLYILSVIIILFVLFLPWKIIVSYKFFQLLNQLQFVNRFLIIPLMLLSFIFSLIITQYLSSNRKNTISVLVILIAILLQLIMGQYSTIHKFNHYQSVGNYLDNNDLGKDISKFTYYHIDNSKQFNNILNNYYLADDDYIPKSSITMSPYVNRNLGFYNNYHKMKFYHIGYNTFSFSNMKNINKISLPIYLYNKEKLHVYLNGKIVNNYSNSNGLLTIDNIQHEIKSNNKVYIKSNPDFFRIAGCILSMFGWLFAFGVLIKYKIAKFFKINQNN